MYDTNAENGDGSDTQMAWIREGGALVPIGRVEVDRGEGIATDGGVEAAAPAETTDRGCERCDDTSLADLKAARNPDGSVDHVCEDCYRDGRGRAGTTRNGVGR